MKLIQLVSVKREYITGIPRSFMGSMEDSVEPMDSMFFRNNLRSGVFICNFAAVNCWIPRSKE